MKTENEKEISPKYIPTRLPIQFSAIVFLLCERFAVSGWLAGVIGSLMVIIWIACGYRIATVDRLKPSEI